MIMQSDIKIIEQGFHVSGDLVFTTVSDLLEIGKKTIIESDSNTIQINLDSVKRVDSAGIALLIAWRRDCLSAKKTCQYQGISAQATSLIETYKLQDIIKH